MACPGKIARRTQANGINSEGDIVGVFTDAMSQQHGFLRRAGEFTTIDYPGAVATSANGINPSGHIVGSYTAPYTPGVSDLVPEDSPFYCPAAGSAACIKGFLYRDGTFSTVLFPGHRGAIPQRITPQGDIHGCLHDFDLGMSMYGAALTRSGELSLMADGGELDDPSQFVPMSMNNGATPGGHTIVGLWDDMGHRRGFKVEKGVFKSYDVPNSTLTAIWDINPSQQFVGTYVDSTGRRHGFLQLPDGSAPINVDYKGAAATIAFGINPDGVIVGQYTASGVTHGFVAVPVTEP
jgi:probable HAF family extracellular repeat protein